MALTDLFGAVHLQSVEYEDVVAFCEVISGKKVSAGSRVLSDVVQC